VLILLHGLCVQCKPVLKGEHECDRRKGRQGSLIWGKRARLHVVGGEKLSWQVESISGSLDGKDESEAGSRSFEALVLFRTT
jgi:hypothetical protein